MINNLITNPSLYAAEASNEEKEEPRDARLERALLYRKTLHPIIEKYLDPQNQDPESSQLQKDLDDTVDNIEKLDIKTLYYQKFQKGIVLSRFIDKVFNDPGKYNVSFNSPPSVNDKYWTNVLLIYDFLYYGPVTILCLERILKQTEDLTKNPNYRIMKDMIDENEVTEIRVNNHRDIYYEAGNKVLRWNVPFLSEKQLTGIIERMISESNIVNNSSISLNSSSPIADFEHPCGYIRGAAVVPPAAEAPFFSLRIHPKDPFTLDQLIKFGMLNQDIGDFLIAAQQAGTTIAIAGTMGSGKTTILSALAEHWPDNGRKATIEDTPELKPRIADLIKMRTIEYDRQDVTNIDVTKLTKACKRHTVRYVVLSEARDGSAWEILQLSQSILGTLMTFHYTVRGNKFLVDQALGTLVALCKQHHLAPDGHDIKRQIASMVQILLLIEQDPVDHFRRVIKVYFITGYDEMNGGHFKFVELFEYSKDPENPGFRRVNSCPEFEEYMKLKGVDYSFNAS